MKDKHIRHRMHTHTLPLLHKRDSLVVDEFNLARLHRKSARADIVVVDGQLFGYEIKSEQDSLARLSRQVPIYDASCERPGLVVAEKHLVKSLDKVSPWWDVYVVTGEEERPVIERYREGWTSEELSARSLLDYLWKRELVGLVQSFGLDVKPTSRKFWSLYNEAIHDLTPEEAAIIVNRVLRNRARGNDWFRDYYFL